MKKFGINGELQKNFFDVIHCFSLAKAALNAPRVFGNCSSQLPHLH